MNYKNLLKIDPYLRPFEKDIANRMTLYEQCKKDLLSQSKSLKEFANAHLYYGFHPLEDGWVYREWAPNAEALHLIGDFNGWNRSAHPLKECGLGNWEIFIDGYSALPHGSEVKVQVTADKKVFDRIPLYSKRVVQKSDHSFNAEIWNPSQAFFWTDHDFIKSDEAPLIYECHIGISSEEEEVASYQYFTKNVLPRIKKLGYNTIQIMALLEHPYYASYGYQVSNFFAASSRFGTPEDLKELVNTAHQMGIAVFCDMVHSHAAPNTQEGINAFDGSEYQFFHTGEKGNHLAWGTKCFNYGKPEVIHFLLSNLKFWMEEYHLDGFRFDGVTSMLYHNHGLGESFDRYEKYFSLNTDVEAITYLQLANELIKEVNPRATSIAEDMSGMPGIAVPIADGGIGFDYRLSMGVPDFWIKTLSLVADEHWNLQTMWHELSTRRASEKNIGYCESHDQAIVGDKTIMFWLADQEMYWHMNSSSDNFKIDRAMALHKLIRLVTFSLAGEGYLNFIGNEFGHPEWIDLPREGNNNSYHYARRQWGLVDNKELKYHYLNAFDQAMLALEKQRKLFEANHSNLLWLDNTKKLMLYERGDYLFAFNFHPTDSGRLDVPQEYREVLNTAAKEFGGSGNEKIGKRKKSSLLIEHRTAIVFEK